MITYLDIALIITSIALIAAVVIQNKGIGLGLGGLTGMDSGGVFAKRRGIEKIIFIVTIILSIFFIALTLITVRLGSI